MSETVYLQYAKSGSMIFFSRLEFFVGVFQKDHTSSKRVWLIWTLLHVRSFSHWCFINDFGTVVTTTTTGVDGGGGIGGWGLR